MKKLMKSFVVMMAWMSLLVGNVYANLIVENPSPVVSSTNKKLITVIIALLIVLLC